MSSNPFRCLPSIVHFPLLSFLRAHGLAIVTKKVSPSPLPRFTLSFLSSFLICSPSLSYPPMRPLFSIPPSPLPLRHRHTAIGLEYRDSRRQSHARRKLLTPQLFDPSYITLSDNSGINFFSSRRKEKDS